MTNYVVMDVDDMDKIRAIIDELGEGWNGSMNEKAVRRWNLADQLLAIHSRGQAVLIEDNKIVGMA